MGCGAASPVTAIGVCFGSLRSFAFKGRQRPTASLGTTGGIQWGNIIVILYLGGGKDILSDVATSAGFESPHKKSILNRLTIWLNYTYFQIHRIIGRAYREAKLGKRNNILSKAELKRCVVCTLLTKSHMNIPTFLF